MILLFHSQWTIETLIRQHSSKSVKEMDEIQNMTYSELYNYFDCDQIFSEKRPLPREEIWIHAQQTFENILNDFSKNTNVKATRRDGFHVAHEAKYTISKGRGIFAAQDIPKGTLVWSTRRTIFFASGSLYRKFLIDINRNFVCDFIEWSWVQTFQDGTSRIAIALDDGSLCNDAGDTANIGCNEEFSKLYKGGCVHNYIALHDIKFGDELLCDYSSFVTSGPDAGWKQFSL
ncbi:hypothetical protein CTEN210_00739 [Chaetoceros tenuissimus]|uniref:SET domain-containing protein n=1 Tax=Chaetoceros tenuissimus TaxID=426638 RepID=A0AAD3CGM4_9STRA|nr:hypothetical protein CTEN210_00739 [Chaetoceros tenuissimus]